MVKMIALFKRPADTKAFMEHYENVHLPLIRKMPGLRKVEYHRMFHPRGKDADPFLMAELCFDNRDTMLASIQSPEGKAGGQDLQEFAPDLVTLMFADVDTEEL